MKIFLISLLLLTTIANTSADRRNALRKTKSADILANRLSQTASSALINDKEKINDETRFDWPCFENPFSPCRCTLDNPTFQITVDCYDETVETVRDVFQRANFTEIDVFIFSVDSPSDNATNIIFIPEDFLGNTSVIETVIISGSNVQYRNFVIDPSAFRSSQNSLRYFSIKYWDSTFQKDFSFLSGFNSLSSLSISDATNVDAFQYLPPLPSLESLGFGSSPDINQIAFPDLSPAKLKSLSLGFSEISDQTADRIVAKVLASTSAGSLKALGLRGNNNLTKTPIQIGLGFPQLTHLYVDYNNISHIPSSSVIFVSPNLQYLDYSRNRMNTIESGAFQGNFTMTKIYLGYNELVVFEEGVFKEILQQMVSVQPPIGFVSIGYNPFACDCDMAWLIRDNRHLLPVVHGTCAVDSPFSSVPFEDLDPESFAQCP